jgi:hypothetical protein
MAVKYRRLRHNSRDHELVSLPWFVLLHDITDDGDIDFNINEAKRMIRRQWQLVREKGVWSPSNQTGAAKPTPWAPHIRVGRFDHAIDADNADGLIREAAERGVTLRRTVPGEPWHLEADRDELMDYYLKHRARVLGIGHRTIRVGMRGQDVRRARVLLRQKGILPASHKAGFVYWPKIARQVKAWKKRRGFGKRGQIDAKMWRYLERD